MNIYSVMLFPLTLTQIRECLPVLSQKSGYPSVINTIEEEVQAMARVMKKGYGSHAQFLDRQSSTHLKGLTVWSLLGDTW